MLLRLYEPILFRNITAANNAVRCNAFLLLFDAFPIQAGDPPTLCHAYLAVILLKHRRLMQSSSGRKSLRAAH